MAQTRCAAEAGTLLEAASGVAPEANVADFRRHNTRKTEHCKENYETDVIGDSRRNRTGTASDTKAVATAIIVVGKGSALPTGIGRFWM